MRSIKNGAKLLTLSDISKSITLNITQLTHPKRAKSFIHRDSRQLLKITCNMFYNTFTPA